MLDVNQLFSFRNKTIVVTGGAGHLGRVLCKSFARLDANIAIVDMSEEAGNKLLEELEGIGEGSAKVYQLDLGNLDLVKAKCAEIIEDFPTLHSFIHAAALVNTEDLKGLIGSFNEQSPLIWQQAFQVNITSAFAIAQKLHSALQKGDDGNVILVGSIYGVVAPDMRLYKDTELGNSASYSVSKGGLLQLMRWLSSNMAPDVRVNMISPGGIWRNQPEVFVERYAAKTPLKRMATEEDMIGTVLYLASKMSSYVTGQNIQVDGGWTVW